MDRLFVNQLTVLDFSYLHPRRGLLGESWLVSVELGGALDTQGMVLDFGCVKKRLKGLIDDQFDHRLLVPRNHPGLVLNETQDTPHLRFTTDTGEIIEHRAPRQALCLIPGTAISPDSVARQIEERFESSVPSNVESIRIRLQPEAIDGAFYQYSHGLKQHDGNCQRIAHGHRSALHILRNGQRDTALEQQWAECWKDCYIGSIDDLTSHPDAPCRHFHYHAPQGEFSLTLPAARCYLIDTESTVENLARHIAEQLHRKHPHEHFEVRAFEGIGKGAIAERPAR